MTTNRIIPGSSDAGDDREHNAEVRAFFADVATAEVEQGRFGAAAPAAMRRLAQATYGHDNSQALVITAALASIYNGADSWPVRLDEIRGVDWTLQRDLVTVMLGTGHGNFADTAIREAYREIGGDQAVDWFHWHVTGARHREKLQRLVAFIKDHQHSGSGKALLSCFRSIVRGRKDAALGHLNYEDDELTEAFVIVLDGLWGRDKGMLYIEDVARAFEDAGVAELLGGESVERAKSD